MKRLSALLGLAALIAGCTSVEISEEEFLSFSTPMIVSSGKTLLQFDENSCQTALNREKGEFRLMKDNLTDFFSISLENPDAAAGETVKGNLTFSTPEDIIEKKNLEFEVLKSENGLAWIKNDPSRLKIIIQR